MRTPARFWLTLTQFALIAGCSGRLPLDINGSAPDRQKLPVEFAGNGSDVMRGAAGAAGGRWRGSAGADVMPQPRERPAVCGDQSIQPGELCDGNNLNGATCASLGFSTGQLACNATTCNFDTIMCRMSPGRWGGTPPPVTGADAGTDDAGY